MTNKSEINNNHEPELIFTSEEIIDIMMPVIGKTFGEIVINVPDFWKTKNKGIAGHIIEKYVLGYNLNSKSEPDIEIDGIETEVKTTGIRIIKNKFVAKEPVSITGVFIDKIVNEEFEESHFWHKSKQMLLVYYLYDYNGPYNIQAYRDFIIKGYEIKVITDEDRSILESDWTMVRDFIRYAQTQDDPTLYYPGISNLQLMYLDVSPKYPNLPRFRFKRSYVNSFVQDFFDGKKQTVLPFSFHKYSEFDEKCKKLTDIYKGQTVFELVQQFQIIIKTIDKSISERIVLKMFESDEHKINNIRIFNKLGLIGKTLVQNINNEKTEDMKLFKINFDEIRNPNLLFEESQFYSFFKDRQILTIFFQEQTSNNVIFGENKFVGFKRISFSESFIQKEVKPIWLEIRRLVNNNELKEIFEYNADGTLRLTPKTKLPKSAPNFPKSENHIIFVRGSGKDKSRLPLEINNIKMYSQYLWIRGKEMNEELNGHKQFS